MNESKDRKHRANPPAPIEETHRSEADPPGAGGLPTGTGTDVVVDYERSTTSGRRSAGAGAGPGRSSGRGNKQ